MEEDDNSVTMVDVLKEQEAFEENAKAVLGASDDKNCTYTMGYVKRQALYACLTCCPESVDDPSCRSGLCLACSLACHENHTLIELYTKRNFRCDCGGPKFKSKPCTFNGQKSDSNNQNQYNQNFSGLYCICHRPYPDPDETIEDEMIQCIVCEDWFHSRHLETKLPPPDQYSEMICQTCMDKNDFLNDYLCYEVLNGKEIDQDASNELNLSENISENIQGNEHVKSLHSVLGSLHSGDIIIDSSKNGNTQIEMSEKDNDNFLNTEQTEQNDSALEQVTKVLVVETDNSTTTSSVSHPTVPLGKSENGKDDLIDENVISDIPINQSASSESKIHCVIKDMIGDEAVPVLNNNVSDNSKVEEDTSNISEINSEIKNSSSEVTLNDQVQECEMAREKISMTSHSKADELMEVDNSSAANNDDDESHVKEIFEKSQETTSKDLYGGGINSVQNIISESGDKMHCQSQNSGDTVMEVDEKLEPDQETESLEKCQELHSIDIQKVSNISNIQTQKPTEDNMNFDNIEQDVDMEIGVNNETKIAVDNSPDNVRVIESEESPIKKCVDNVNEKCVGVIHKDVTTERDVDNIIKECIDDAPEKNALTEKDVEKLPNVHIENSLEKLVDNTLEKIDNASEKIKNSTDDVVDNTTEKISNTADEVDNATEKVKNASDEVVDNAIEKVKNASDEVVDNATEKVKNASDEVVDNATEKVGNISDDVVDNDIEKSENATDDSATEKVEIVINEVIDNATEKVENATDEAVDSATEKVEIVINEVIDNATDEAINSATEKVEIVDNTTENIVDNMTEDVGNETKTDVYNRHTKCVENIVNNLKENYISSLIKIDIDDVIEKVDNVTEPDNPSEKIIDGITEDVNNSSENTPDSVNRKDIDSVSEVDVAAANKVIVDNISEIGNTSDGVADMDSKNASSSDSKEQECMTTNNHADELNDNANFKESKDEVMEMELEIKEQDKLKVDSEITTPIANLETDDSKTPINTEELKKSDDLTKSNLNESMVVDECVRNQLTAEESIKAGDFSEYLKCDNTNKGESATPEESAKLNSENIESMDTCYVENTSQSLANTEQSSGSSINNTSKCLKNSLVTPSEDSLVTPSEDSLVTPSEDSLVTPSEDSKIIDATYSKESTEKENNAINTGKAEESLDQASDVNLESKSKDLTTGIVEKSPNETIHDHEKSSSECAIHTNEQNALSIKELQTDSNTDSESITTGVTTSQIFTNETACDTFDNKKRKHDVDSSSSNIILKKIKIKEEVSLQVCIKPVTCQKSKRKGAVFWPSDWRSKLCSCSCCLDVYNEKQVAFLLDMEDTVSAYEDLGKIKTEASSSQYEKGMEALSSLGHVQQINAITEYNKMKEKLLEFLKTFKDKKEVVKEEDIKGFFAGMKPKREPDGVYFCQ